MNTKKTLIEKIYSKQAVVGIIGLGYVGLPLALLFSEKGFNVVGFDVDEKKVSVLNSCKSYIKHIAGERIKKNIKSEKFIASTDFSFLTTCDAVLICVPTPLNAQNEPEMKYVIDSAKIIAKHIRQGQLIVLESSTYPGTTNELLLPMFQERFIHEGKDKKEIVGSEFFLAFSPEREDPNNPDFNTETIPKIVGGVTNNCLDVAVALYNQAVKKTVPVSSAKVAEAAKLLENIYRSVNVALVNELKMIFDKMGIDVWEVINAAKTKPFGFQAFYPGPGLGGHCIPIDPFYLSWKAREYEIETKFIELAGEINTYQPFYVAMNTIDALNKNGKSLKDARILILGVAYKKNVDDMRESPSLKLIEIFEGKGAFVDYSDPYIAKLPATRKYNFQKESVPVNSDTLLSYDLVLLSTDHDSLDYNLISANAKLIVDTRNAFGSRNIYSPKIVKT
jgi:UDP-N-acetyl-D-glucosamine dehydrogenase